jgi:hypothetical protein
MHYMSRRLTRLLFTVRPMQGATTAVKVHYIPKQNFKMRHLAQMRAL